MNRRTLSNRAVELCGGVQGFSTLWDPSGLGELVTEGRWRLKDGHGRFLSCCEDLLSRLAFEAVDLKKNCKWTNRKDAGNTWVPGENLIRIKRHAAYAWLGYFNGSKFDIRIGDGVQVQNQYGPHSLVVTEITYNPDGTPASCDTANFGQFHSVNGKPAAPSSRLFVGQPISRDATGLWRINNHRVIGRLDIMALREREVGVTPELPGPGEAPPEGDGGSDVTPAVQRSLKFCVRGDDVKAWQERLNEDGAGLKADGIFGARTKKATQEWQKAHGLVADGVVGPKTRAAAGM